MNFIFDKETITGHDSYLKIMRMIADLDVDVSKDRNFQKSFIGYYFAGPKPQAFRNFYFFYMQQCRSVHPSYAEILHAVYDRTGEVHYSLSSKLLHTIDPEHPILDRHVMRLLGFTLLDSSHTDASTRINYYGSVFDTISAEYKQYKDTSFMQEAIDRFDVLFPTFRDIPYTKKVDMLLFRLRNERGASVLDYLFETY